MGFPAEILPIIDPSKVSLIKLPVNTEAIICSEINVRKSPNNKITPSKTGVAVRKPLSALENADKILLLFLLFMFSVNN